MNPPIVIVREQDGAVLRAESAGRNLVQARLRAAIGTDAPRWWWHVGCAVHAAPELGLFHRQPTLLLGNDLTGAAELEAMAAPDDVAADEALTRAAWQALAAAALDTVRAAPARWGRRLVVELPGVRDAQQRSPFWQGLGRHFHSGDVQAEAAQFGAEAWRRHIAALMPRQLLYTSFLDAAAQAAIGAVPAGVRAQHEGLVAAGLRFADHVRIDDGGAVMEAVLP
jgi:arginine N-succinyltransferase